MVWKWLCSRAYNDYINFDALTENAIFMYAGKKPLVVTCENLAQYINVLSNRFAISNIHRNLMLHLKTKKMKHAKLRKHESRF